MAMMTESRTDERLGALGENMEVRFDAVDQRFEAVDQRFDAVDQRFDAVDQRFDRLEADVRELRRLMLYGFISLATMMFTGFAGQAFF
jgi:hypothetical protein